MSDYERPWVEFDNGYILTAGKPDQWIIRKRVNETMEPGDEDFNDSDFRAVGHYATLTNALRALLNKFIIESQARSLEELKENLEDARRQIVDGLKGEL